jgi:hypothetical protein
MPAIPTTPGRPGLPMPQPTDIACPAWCERGHGHPYRAHADGLRRLHTRHLADLDRWGLALSTDQVEQAASPVGPIDLDDAVTVLGPLAADFEATRCTADDLRDLADALTRAADALDASPGATGTANDSAPLCGAWNDSHDCHQPADHPSDHTCAGCGDLWNRGPWDDDADDWAHQRSDDRCTDPAPTSHPTGCHARHDGEA